MLPTYVRVQYRFSEAVDPLIFEAVGLTQQGSPSVKGPFGGLMFAYDKFNIRVWAPRRVLNDTFVVFVGQGWGDGPGHAVYNDTAHFRVQVRMSF